MICLSGESKPGQTLKSVASAAATEFATLFSNAEFSPRLFVLFESRPGYLLKVSSIIAVIAAFTAFYGFLVLTLGARSRSIVAHCIARIRDRRFNG